jgi:hypothetical protein
MSRSCNREKQEENARKKISKIFNTKDYTEDHEGFCRVACAYDSGNLGIARIIEEKSLKRDEHEFPYLFIPPHEGRMKDGDRLVCFVAFVGKKVLRRSLNCSA